MPIEQLRAFDPEDAAILESFDRRTDDEPDLSHLRALRPDMLALAAWARGQSSIVGDQARDGSEEA
jgi:hypothetical protein